MAGFTTSKLHSVRYRKLGEVVRPGQMDMRTENVKGSTDTRTHTRRHTLNNNNNKKSDRANQDIFLCVSGDTKG